MREFEKFNAVEVPLKGSNLIEASAGTGKTYSIAILVLRLILEQGLTIKEILMVTFTKAAVAELEERIRLFVRLAYRTSNGEEIKDSTIKLLVGYAIAKSGKEDVCSKLKEAVLFLDETSVLTIHSFCQQTLNEFAFETKQLFGADLLQDTSAILEEEINKYWRKNITAIPARLLNQLINSGLSRNQISTVVREHLGGKRYLEYKAGENYSLCEEDHLSLLASLEELVEKETELRNCLKQRVVDEVENIRNRTEQNVYNRKNALHLVDFPDEFINFLSVKRGLANVIKTYPELLVSLSECDDVIQERKEILQQLFRKIYCLAINEISKGVELYKGVHNQLSFDDLIVNLHEAFKRNEALLAECLQRKYKAVFIDEFQDTDRLQYEIFDKAFGKDTILFYIGDPKQSIYAWRKADIYTYFAAKKKAAKLYSMNQNYRSSAPLIDAMNVFFMPDESFDTFHFQHEKEAIDYIHVDSPTPNTKGNLQCSDGLEIPMTITELPNKDAICQAVAKKVLELLATDRWMIETNGNTRRITPADIGILVRGNKEGQDIKAKLAALGIPAVTMGDAKVLQSEESRYLLYVLEAMTDISRAAINKALLIPFTGFDDEHIVRLDDEVTTENFRRYKAVWEKDGIYATLNAFITDYNVKNVLLSDNALGERIITNLYQLIELLHKIQTSKKLSPTELISWLKRGREGMETSGDEYEQRIESDEEAVKIVTIHKSKGLEYKIVFAPFLDLKVDSKHDHCSFRDSHTGEYVSAEKSQLSIEQKAEHDRQLEQENRRLIYVAITRGVYKCFIYKNTAKKGSSLSYFVNSVKLANSGLIEISDEVNDTNDLRYAPRNPSGTGISRPSVAFKLLEQNWRKMSFTMLSADHEYVLKNRGSIYPTEYDNFMFFQLRNGMKTGNMLHYIFENIHFDDSSKWNYVVERAVERFMPGQAENMSPMLLEMLSHVMKASIAWDGDEFSLSNVSPKKCIHEFEFDFRVSNFNASSLRVLSDNELELNIKDYSELEGVMNGKIDLFFEHKRKYYVLDWKSNFLGDSLRDYTSDRVAAAMNENNYHLQHLLYTLASKKYLESRIPDFDYETQFGGVIYLFVRGLREECDTGIFKYRAPLTKIEELNHILTGMALTEI